jgi:DNA-binding MarR family transcriptional regulator
MNDLFFAIKRAFHGTLRVGRLAIAELRCKGLTPARFDMMFALQSDDFIAQRELQRMLGVSKTTVSRMVRSLVELGYVARERDESDRRSYFVWLTELGWDCIHRAGQALVESGAIEATVKWTLAQVRPRFSVARCGARRASQRTRLPREVRRRRRLKGLLTLVRTAFQAGGSLHYQRPQVVAERLPSFFDRGAAAHCP